MADATVPATAPARELTPQDAFRRDISRMEGEFKAALPDQIPAARFVRTVITAVQMNPSLLQADRRSLFAACMKAAQDGLLPDGREAALVVYSVQGVPTVQYLPMIGGILKAARNSGEIASITAHAVYEKDTFSYVLGDDEAIKHVAYLGEDGRGRVIAAYSIIKTKDGGIYRAILTRSEIDRIKRIAKGAWEKDGSQKRSSPWYEGDGGWFDRQAEKSAAKRCCKFAPTSSDRLASILANDEDNYDFTPKGPEKNITPHQAALAPGQQLRALVGADEQPKRRGRRPAEQPATNGVTVTRNDTNGTTPTADTAPPQSEADRIRGEIAFRLQLAPESWEFPAALAGWQASDDVALLNAALDAVNGVI